MSKNASVISKNAYLKNVTNRDQNAINREHLLNDTTTYLTMQ
jgi:hypothetical protein